MGASRLFPLRTPSPAGASSINHHGVLKMTDVNRRTYQMPRGRQTIRRAGSLLGFHGPVSRRIKLWTSDPKPNTIIAQLERAYFAALETVDRMEERSRRNAASGRFTPEGMKADVQQFALNDLLPALHRGRQSISKAKVELAERKAKLASRQDGEIDELEEAIAAAESAVEAAHEEVRVEAGLRNQCDFNNVAVSIQRTASAVAQAPQGPERDGTGTGCGSRAKS